MLVGTFAPPEPPDPAVAAWDAFKALAEARGIQFLSSPNLQDIYEADPAEGTLTEAHPTAILTDGNFGFERIRLHATADHITIDRGSMSSNATQFMGLLGDPWTIYLLNEDTSEYVAWRANAGASGGAGRARWTFGGSTFHEVASSIAGTYRTFIDSLPNANVIIGMANNADWRPYT